jgi:hypothetical protein
MSQMPMSGTARPSGAPLHQLSRADFSTAPVGRLPGGRNRPPQAASAALLASAPAKIPAQAPATSPEPLVALGLPRPALPQPDPKLAEQYYRAAVLREIGDLMRTHGLGVDDIAAAVTLPRRRRSPRTGVHTGTGA